jgi:hypothetical protein
MDAAPRARNAARMQSMGRQGPFLEQVQIAMNRRDERRTPTSNAPLAGRRHTHHNEQMARWENEGGSLGHTAGQRPRPLP